MPLRLRGRAERYGHSFDRNKMSVDLSEYLVGQVLQSKRRQFGVLQKSFATADRDDWRLAVAGERWRKCFPDRLTDSAWLPKLKEIIPTFGVNLIEDAKACDRIRTETAPVLKVENL